MKRIIAVVTVLLTSMAVTVFAEEEVVWEEQTATEDVMYAFEEEETEQIADEAPQYVFEEPAIVEEDTVAEDTEDDEIAFDENVVQEDSVFEEAVVSEEVAGDEANAADESSAAASVAVEGLVYTGEPQELITAQPGDWLYSLDGEEYGNEIPTGINAGEYTVYMKEGDGEPVVIAVSIAKADVIFTPPVANTSEASEPVE